MTKNKLKIKEFSLLCQVTVKTLRHYEKLGLLDCHLSARTGTTAEASIYTEEHDEFAKRIIRHGKI